MLRIDRKISVFISIALTAVMFAGTVALAFYMPSFLNYLLDLPDPAGKIPELSASRQTLVYIAAYADLTLMLAGLSMLFALLMLVKREKVFTAAAVELIRYISWCLILMGLVTMLMAFFSAVALCVGAAVLFVGLTVRVVKNVIEAAVCLKEENDLTV